MIAGPINRLIFWRHLDRSRSSGRGRSSSAANIILRIPHGCHHPSDCSAPPARGRQERCGSGEWRWRRWLVLLVSGTCVRGGLKRFCGRCRCCHWLTETTVPVVIGPKGKSIVVIPSTIAILVIPIARCAVVRLGKRRDGRRKSCAQEMQSRPENSGRSGLARRRALRRA